MKTKVLAITTLFCSFLTIYAFGTPKENYRVLHKEANRTEIEILGDCDIVVADIAPNGKEKIYGDKIGNVTYGGASDQLFRNNQVTPNGTKKGVEVHRVNRRIVLAVKYASLENTEIQIVSAVYKDSLQAKPDKAGFFPGSPFIISVKKSRMEGNVEATPGADVGASLPGRQTVYNAFEIKDLKESVGILSQEVSQLKKKTVLYDILSLLITLLIGLLIGYFLFRQNRKVLKKLIRENSYIKNVIENKEKNNVQILSHQTTLEKNKEKGSMTDDDIKRFIIEQIKSQQSQNISSINQPSVETNLVSELVPLPDKKEERVADTDNVKYHQDDNSFSLEQTDIKIFRIYSKKGEFYYTIVDDSAVREELIGMLQMFEGCITYQTTDGVAKRVEPVTEGKLRRDGNKFYVDANNKLVVKFA